MLMTLNAYRPAIAKASRPNSTMVRRLRQAAMMALSMGCREVPPPEARSVARGRVENVAHEHRAVRDHQVAALQARQHRVLPVERLAQLDDALREAATIRRDPCRKAAIAVAHYAIHRYGE